MEKHVKFKKGKNIMGYKIYGRTDCDYCEASKILLDKVNRPYEYIDISDYNEDKKEELKNKYNMNTIPIVLNWNGSLIGGYSELRIELEDTSGGFGDGRLG
jgi:glutaredoxin